MCSLPMTISENVSGIGHFFRKMFQKLDVLKEHFEKVHGATVL